MGTGILIILIAAYSLCLVHITLFIVIYIKHKNKIELYYLIVLSNIFLLAVVVMLAFITNRSNVIPILVNSVFSLYVTIPLFSYILFEADKKWFKLIPVLVIAEAIIDNLLIKLNHLGVLYALKIFFYIVLTLPALLTKKNTYEKNSLEWNMQKITKIIIITFVPFTILLIPFSSMIFEKSYLSTLFWVVCALFFQIPGFVYCKKYLLQVGIATVSKPGLSSLSKRENDVALAICSGLKYGAIAEKLLISLSAVKYHASSIYKKLGIKNNRELMHIFIESQKMALFL
jgi:DNA-binding CsgD family transcriptional regulator